jgi:glutamate dehydrogenase/leucine dehydrogenase
MQLTWDRAVPLTHHAQCMQRRPEWGGSQIRPEATGYGAVFFAENILKDEGRTLEVGARVLDCWLGVLLS